MLEDQLKREVVGWEAIGARPLMQRYILAKGQHCHSQMLPPRFKQGMKKQCFANAIRLTKRHSNTLRYVEGYGLSSSGIPLLFHHAWTIDKEDRVIDPTWRNTGEAHYFGRVFTIEEWERETDRTECQSVLDSGIGLNHVFMFEDMPTLRAEIEAVAPVYRFREKAA